MRSLLLVAMLGLSALLLEPASAHAQYYPQFPFGGVYPVPYRTYDYGYTNGQLYSIQRYGYVYPGSGYTWGYQVGYMPNMGISTGYYRGNLNPFYSSYQFYPTYYSPGYYYAAQPQANYGYAKTPTYSYPSYYVPTY